MDDLKLIKRHYGEKMMHLCRELFPTLLETPGLLFTILSKTFNFSRLLYDDIVNAKRVDEFKDLIYNTVDYEKRRSNKSAKTPKELLDEAGYILYECHTEEEIQSFKKYYKKGEELCTFHGDRLDRCHVFFAVKKNADEIKREDFAEPKRQDEYGTSVISIQFSRGKSNTLSIKNRYNHTVPNPDATFSNNLDNIIPGLTDAFEDTYGLDITGKNTYFNLPGYVLANDGKYYKYNVEYNNIYYCTDNIIIDNFEVKQFDKSRYLLVDYFLIDFKEKTIKTYDEVNLTDSFIDGLKNIKDIKVETNKETNEKTIIINNEIIIVINNKNQIKSYKNDQITHIGDNFLYRTLNVEKIDLPNVTDINSYFLQNNIILKEINIPQCTKIGACFLFANKVLPKLSLPVCEEIGAGALSSDIELKELDLPVCKRIGYDDFYSADVEELDLPECEEIGSNFMRKNIFLRRISLPKCKKIGMNFLQSNTELRELDLPEVKEIGESFLERNNRITKISFPKCEEIKNYFLNDNHVISELDLPEIKVIGTHFLHGNEVLTKLYLPKCRKIGAECMSSEKNKIEEIDLPEIIEIGDYFLLGNIPLKKINIPKCIYVGQMFLSNNQGLEEIDLSNVQQIGVMPIKHLRFRKHFIDNPDIKIIVNEEIINKNNDDDKTK